MVKDHRSGHQVSNVEKVFEGELDGFMLSGLAHMAGKHR
jgi:hypothetical protein